MSYFEKIYRSIAGKEKEEDPKLKKINKGYSDARKKRILDNIDKEIESLKYDPDHNMSDAQLVKNKKKREELERSRKKYE